MWRLSWGTSYFLQTHGWRFWTSMFRRLAPRMSCMNGLLAFTASTSFQPSFTATRRFCSGQISSQWTRFTRTVIRIPSCVMRRLPWYSSALQTVFWVWCWIHASSVNLPVHICIYWKVHVCIVCIRGLIGGNICTHIILESYALCI